MNIEIIQKIPTYDIFKRLYFISVDCNFYRVNLTNEYDLTSKEKLKLTCFGKTTWTLFTMKVVDKNKCIKSLNKRRKIELKDPHFQFGHKWYDTFSEKRLYELFKKYYVDGYKIFCLAITPENKDNLPLYKFLLPEYLLECPIDKFTREQLNIGVCNYYEEWINVIRNESGNRYMSKAEFINWIKKIRDVVRTTEDKPKMDHNECKKLNLLCKELPSQTDITTDIMHSFVNSFTKDLSYRLLISQCQFCGDFFPYKVGKKYCSFIREGKDCGKSARNRKYYLTRGIKRLSRYRKITRNLRSFYKEKGIRK